MAIVMPWAVALVKRDRRIYATGPRVPFDFGATWAQHLFQRRFQKESLP
jgi:hypothetical protein